VGARQSVPGNTPDRYGRAHPRAQPVLLRLARLTNARRRRTKYPASHRSSTLGPPSAIGSAAPSGHERVFGFRLVKKFDTGIPRILLLHRLRAWRLRRRFRRPSVGAGHPPAGVARPVGRANGGMIVHIEPLRDHPHCTSRRKSQSPRRPSRRAPLSRTVPDHAAARRRPCPPGAGLRQATTASDGSRTRRSGVIRGTARAVIRGRPFRPMIDWVQTQTLQ
jgi:hypothetical protein